MIVFIKQFNVELKLFNYYKRSHCSKIISIHLFSHQDILQSCLLISLKISIKSFLLFKIVN